MLQNKLAVSSVSLGQHASHTLPQKVNAAAQAGIAGLEITYPDLDDFAKSLSLPILSAAREARRLCDSSKLKILAFAAFENFEGQPSPLSDRLQTAREWLAIANNLGAEHLQVPSNYDRSATGDPDVVASDLRQLCDLARSMKPPIKIAYENLGWGTHCSTWQHALQIVHNVGRENFGLCLDSFHFCVALWADPYREDSIQPHGERQLGKSLQALVRLLPLEKLFYLQLSDGEKLDPPYSPNHPWYNPQLQPGHVWSSEARPFPLETEYGGYMPVAEVARAFLLELGYTGWVSMETFDRRMRSEDQGPSRNARRAARSWENLRSRLDEAKTLPGKL